MTSRNAIIMGDALLAILREAERYALAYKRHHEGPIGADGVLGDGIHDILHGVRTLLNGDLGHQDGGDLWRLSQSIAVEHDLVDKNGELSAE